MFSSRLLVRCSDWVKVRFLYLGVILLVTLVVLVIITNQTREEEGRTITEEISSSPPPVSTSPTAPNPTSRPTPAWRIPAKSRMSEKGFVTIIIPHSTALDLIWFHVESYRRYMLNPYQIVFVSDAEDTFHRNAVMYLCRTYEAMFPTIVGCIDSPDNTHGSHSLASKKAAEIINFIFGAFVLDTTMPRGTLVVHDSDMLLYRPIDVIANMHGYAMVCSKQVKVNSANVKIEYPYNGLFFMDTRFFPTDQMMGWGPVEINGVDTDTGGEAWYWMGKHGFTFSCGGDNGYHSPDWVPLNERAKQFHCFNESMALPTCLAKAQNREFDLIKRRWLGAYGPNYEWIHVRAGNNWFGFSDEDNFRRRGNVLEFFLNNTCNGLDQAII
jgi:hypothetical protein